MNKFTGTSSLTYSIWRFIFFLCHGLKGTGHGTMPPFKYDNRHNSNRGTLAQQRESKRRTHTQLSPL